MMIGFVGFDCCAGHTPPIAARSATIPNDFLILLTISSLRSFRRRRRERERPRLLALGAGGPLSAPLAERDVPGVRVPRLARKSVLEELVPVLSEEVQELVQVVPI